jgi:hypothetical protein
VEGSSFSVFTPPVHYTAYALWWTGESVSWLRTFIIEFWELSSLQYRPEEPSPLRKYLWHLRSNSMTLIPPTLHRLHTCKACSSCNVSAERTFGILGTIQSSYNSLATPPIVPYDGGVRELILVSTGTRTNKRYYSVCLHTQF